MAPGLRGTGPGNALPATPGQLVTWTPRFMLGLAGVQLALVGYFLLAESVPSAVLALWLVSIVVTMAGAFYQKRRLTQGFADVVSSASPLRMNRILAAVLFAAGISAVGLGVLAERLWVVVTIVLCSLAILLLLRSRHSRGSLM